MLNLSTFTASLRRNGAETHAAPPKRTPMAGDVILAYPPDEDPRRPGRTARACVVVKQDIDPKTGAVQLEVCPGTRNNKTRDARDFVMSDNAELGSAGLSAPHRFDMTDRKSLPWTPAFAAAGRQDGPIGVLGEEAFDRARKAYGHAKTMENLQKKPRPEATKSSRRQHAGEAR